jgi:hypothetical protein
MQELEPLPPSLARTWGDTSTLAGRRVQRVVRGLTEQPPEWAAIVDGNLRFAATRDVAAAMGVPVRRVSSFCRHGGRDEWSARYEGLAPRAPTDAGDR